jgi:hypothetical protein
MANLALAYVKFAMEDVPRASELIRESLRFFHTLGDQLGVAGALEAAGSAAIRADQIEPGSRLLAAGTALRQKIGAAREPSAEVLYERDLACARDRLGDAGFAVEWAIGWESSPAEAVDRALTILPASANDGPLPRRTRATENSPR